VKHAILQADLIEARDARDVNQHARRAEFAFDLEQEISPARDHARIRCVLR
jgi:hypothetical protein